MAEAGFAPRFVWPQSLWYHSMAEPEEELKSLLMKAKEEREKAGLKLIVQ